MLSANTCASVGDHRNAHLLKWSRGTKSSQHAFDISQELFEDKHSNNISAFSSHVINLIWLPTPRSCLRNSLLYLTTVPVQWRWATWIKPMSGNEHISAHKSRRNSKRLQKNSYPRSRRTPICLLFSMFFLPTGTPRYGVILTNSRQWRETPHESESDNRTHFTAVEINGEGSVVAKRHFPVN